MPSHTPRISGSGHGRPADGNGNTVLATADGTPVGSWPTDSLASVSVTGDPAGGLTLDLTDGLPLPPAGLTKRKR